MGATIAAKSLLCRISSCGGLLSPEKADAPSPGRLKLFLEEKSGAEVFAQTGQIQYRVLRLDHDANLIREVIKDPKNNVLVEYEQPLRLHVGHGAAKRTRR